MPVGRLTTCRSGETPRVTCPDASTSRSCRHKRKPVLSVVESPSGVAPCPLAWQSYVCPSLECGGPDATVRVVTLGVSQGWPVRQLTAAIVAGVAQAKALGKTPDDVGRFTGNLVAKGWGPPSSGYHNGSPFIEGEYEVSLDQIAFPHAETGAPGVTACTTPATITGLSTPGPSASRSNGWPMIVCRA